MNVLQAAIILHCYKVPDQALWTKVSKNILKMLHKYSGSDLARLLDIFDTDLKNEKGGSLGVIKCDEIFFERITGILPIQLKNLKKENIVRILEVLVKRNLGSERVFRDHLLLKIEKTILTYTQDEYIRTLKALADKQYVDDSVFWNQFILRYIYDTPDEVGARTFTPKKAKQLWDAIFYLKIKCPSIDVKDQIQRLEFFMA